MALKLKLTKAEWDGLDEGFKSLYEDNGADGYTLAVDGIEDTSALKATVNATRRERDELAKQARAWKELGKTPDEIAELVARVSEDELKKAEKAGEWDKLKAQLLESKQKELAVKDEETARMRSALEDHLVTSTAVTAIAELKGIPQLLLPHVKSAVRVVDDNGKYVVHVVDENGTQRINSKGDPLTIKDLVEEMRQSDVFGRAFEATGTSGGGAAGNTGNVYSGTNPFAKGSENLTEQGRIYTENPALYEQLKKKAGIS